MNMKKISAACATAAALAALCVPGAAFAADGTLTLNAGDGSTLAGHSFTVYKLANYNDVVKDGANVKSVSASSPDATTDAWVKAALNRNGVTYNTSEGRNAAEQLLRLKTDSDTLRKVAGTLQSTAAIPKQISCRFVRLKMILFLTLVKSLGTDTNAIASSSFLSGR